MDFYQVSRRQMDKGRRLMAQAFNPISIPSFVFKRLVRIKNKTKQSYGETIEMLINHYEGTEK